MQEVRIRDIRIGTGQPLALIAGPCVLESQETNLHIARTLKELCHRHHLPLIFKASYEKDNRGSEKSYIGPGLEEGIEMLREIREEFGLPLISDVHRVEDVDRAARVLDVLQVPAFLCQQTSLLLKIGKGGKPVNIKKGQFLAPEDIQSAIEKVMSTGNRQILLTERGTCFGYHRLVSDFCSIPIMQSLGFPVVFDATHIVRVYGVPSKDPLGGMPQYVPYLSRAAVACGCNAIFLETHPEPPKALCDASSMLSLDEVEGLLPQLKAISELVRSMGLA